MIKLFFIPFWLTLLVTLPVYAVEKADEKRLDEIAERGSHVMPFDLEKTTHIFTNNYLMRSLVQIPEKENFMLSINE